MAIPSNLVPILEELKFFVGFGGALWTFFTAYNYVKSALTNTQTGVDAIRTELKDQTSAIVKATDTQTNELRTMSSDVKMLVQSMMSPPPRARAARAARRKK